MDLIEWLTSSNENGEKAEKEAEPVVKEEEPEVKEETLKTKAKKEKKPAEEGYELWNELEIQRIKFMVTITNTLSTVINTLSIHYRYIIDTLSTVIDTLSIHCQYITDTLSIHYKL